MLHFVFYKTVDDAIAHVKALTVKNKPRNELFAQIGYPPQPIVTRWASWLGATFYYAKNLPYVRTIVNDLKNEGIIVQRAKESVNHIDLPRQLLEIQKNYTKIYELVQKVES